MSAGGGYQQSEVVPPHDGYFGPLCGDQATPTTTASDSPVHDFFRDRRQQ